MLTRPQLMRPAFWIAPALTTAIAFAFYGPFGVARDFGAFVIASLLVPLLGLIALALGIWTLLERRSWRMKIASLFVATLAPAILIPALIFFGDPLRDPARYAVWSITHRQALSMARQNAGVFKHWDGWGMAGNDNDSYLASDPTDTLSRPGVLDRWASAHHLGCDIVAARRLDRGVYLLNTSNCVINGFPSW